MIWPLCFWISIRRDVRKARFNNKAQVGFSKLLTGRIWSNGWSVMEQCKMRVNFVNVTFFLVYIGATAILGTKLATAMQAVPLLHHIHHDLARFVSNRGQKEGKFLFNSATDFYHVLTGQLGLPVTVHGKISFSNYYRFLFHLLDLIKPF